VQGPPGLTVPDQWPREDAGLWDWTRTHCSRPASTEAARTAWRLGDCGCDWVIRMGRLGSRVAAVSLSAPTRSCARNPLVRPGPVGILRHGVTTVAWPRFRPSAHGPGRRTGPAPEAERVELCQACACQQARSFQRGRLHRPAAGVAISRPSDIQRLPVNGHGRAQRQVTPGAYPTVQERVRDYIVLHWSTGQSVDVHCCAL
jgi:hypothetical protein